MVSLLLLLQPSGCCCQACCCRQAYQEKAPSAPPVLLLLLLLLVLLPGLLLLLLLPPGLLRVPPLTEAPNLLHTLQEIETFCKQASGGATEADPFDGMTPQVCVWWGSGGFGVLQMGGGYRQV